MKIARGLQRFVCGLQIVKQFITSSNTPFWFDLTPVHIKSWVLSGTVQKIVWVGRLWYKIMGRKREGNSTRFFHRFLDSLQFYKIIGNLANTFKIKLEEALHFSRHPYFFYYSLLTEAAHEQTSQTPFNVRKNKTLQRNRNSCKYTRHKMYSRTTAISTFRQLFKC